jgi:hypothetical protein
MYILTTVAGNAYKDTSGMPIFLLTNEEVEHAAFQLGHRDQDWVALELNEEEAAFIKGNAFMAVYGRRYGINQ